MEVEQTFTDIHGSMSNRQTLLSIHTVHHKSTNSTTQIDLIQTMFVHVSTRTTLTFSYDGTTHFDTVR